MAIFIVESPDPQMQRAAGGTASLLAESVAYNRLCRELRRYVEGEITGRSFLIAGHRGAGKTTLVLKAVQDVLNSVAPGNIRPLLVALHGPDLLAPAAKPQTGDKAEDAATESNGKEKDKEQEKKANKNTEPEVTNDAEEVLKQITISMYRSLADEMYRAFRNRAKWLQVLGGPSDRDASELPMALRTELDRPAELAQLRELWKRVRGIPYGVLHTADWDGSDYHPRGARLFAERIGASFPSAQYFLDGSAETSEQGMLELVALSSASLAYQRVSGKLDKKESETSNVSAKQSAAVEVTTEIKNFLSPLFGILTGAGVCVGLTMTTNGSPYLAALAGLLAAVGTTVVLKYSKTRTREFARTTELTFLPDTKISSLDRTLPLLVERCRQAGLALVFVVDELDKVNDLSKRMGPLIQHLKHFVTERSFFCFLADRNYLEALRRNLINAPYGMEYTYFSNRLFVLYRPSDLHAYLKRMLQPRPASPLSSDDEVALALLPYVLLHRSRLHPFDLRRQLAMIQNEQGELLIVKAALASQLGYRFDVLIQVAVEWLLDGPELSERLSQDEEFTQLVYDTLYYPSRMWERGESELNTTKAALVEYLKERISDSLAGNSNNSNGANATTDTARPLNKMDEEFLAICLNQLVGYLLKPDLLKSEISSRNPKRFSATVLEAIPSAGPLAPGSRIQVYPWRYDKNGRPVRQPGVQTVLTPQLKTAMLDIQGMDQALQQLTGMQAGLSRLTSEFKLLSATPAYSAVQDAIARLTELSRMENPQAYPEMENHANIVWEYSLLLTQNAQMLSKALICAKAIAQFDDGSSGQTSLLAGLTALSQQLSLASATAQETKEQVDIATMKLQPAFPGGTLVFPTLESGNVEAWRKKTEEILMVFPTTDFLKAGELPAHAERLSQIWLKRFGHYFGSEQVQVELTMEDLICAVGRYELSVFLRVDLDELSLLDWSNILLMAASPEGKDKNPRRMPAWVVIPALAQVGFVEAAVQITQEVAKIQDTQKAAGPSAGSEVPELIQGIVADVTLPSDLKGWPELIERKYSTTEGGRPIVVILVTKGASVTRNWKTSKRYAVLMTTLTDQKKADDSVERLHGYLSDTMPVRAMVELNPDEPELIKKLSGSPAELGKQYEDIFENIPYNYLLSRAPSVSIPTGIPVVIAPQSLDEAMDKTVGLLPRKKNPPSPPTESKPR
jgi:hypothetical protein